MGRKERPENLLTDKYHSPDKTIKAASEKVLRENTPERVRRVAKTAVSSQVKLDQVHPMLWQWLRENGPKTKGGQIDKNKLRFEPDYHVVPDSETVDSVIIYDTPEQKEAAEENK